jgi:hypothetical protein
VLRFPDICCIKTTSLNPDADSSPVPQESAAAKEVRPPQRAENAGQHEDQAIGEEIRPVPGLV